MLPSEQFEMYGQVLTGTETELDLAKLARRRYLKIKMRQGLAHEVGDDPDTTTDVLRTALLCYAVSAGLVTDAPVITRLNTYVGEMIAGYGGAEAVLDVLEFDKDAVGRHVVEGYFAAKATIDEAETVEAVNAVDLPGDPGLMVQG